MNDIVIKVENVSKLYRLGEVGTGTISHDLNRWWANLRGKEDPFAKVGTVNDRSQKAAKGEHVWALRDINFDVRKGEVLGIIGKNGAGKSTLLKLLSRVTAPTKGEIKARGRIASLLEVGTGFNPEMTGRENIYMNGTILGMRRREITAKLDEIVDFAGVAKYLDTPTKRYSSGMTVRLGFAIAAFLEPEILIVDEVLAVGDAEFQKKAIGKMQDVSKGGGRTVLFVSHNMASIQALCTRGLLLIDGSIGVDGGVENVISHYIAENSKEQRTKFENIDQRDGKEIWIDFATYTVNGIEGSNVFSGQEIEFLVRYKSATHHLNTTLFIGIYSQIGEKILHLGTPYSELESIRSSAEGIFRCKIKKLPLPAGKYYINFSLHINGKPYHRVQKALILVVENGDFFGNGRLPDSKESKFLIEQSWSIEQL